MLKTAERQPRERMKELIKEMKPKDSNHLKAGPTVSSVTNLGARNPQTARRKRDETAGGVEQMLHVC